MRRIEDIRTWDTIPVSTDFIARIEEIGMVAEVRERRLRTEGYGYPRP